MTIDSQHTVDSPSTTGTRDRTGLSELLLRSNLLVVFVLLLVISAVLAPNFLDINNIANLLQQSATTGIVAIGMTLVILTSGIDLAVGSTAAFGGMLVAVLVAGSMPTLLAIVVTLLGGVVIGLVMGALVTYLKLPLFMVTLAGLTGIRGLTYLLTDGQPVSPNFPTWFTLMGGGFLGYVPLMGIFFIVITVIVALVLRYTTFGEYIYAIGSNKEAARLSGLPVTKVSIAVFAISGLLSALAGILLTSRLMVGQPTAFSGLELNAIAAVVLGGTNLFGGRGGVGGTFIAVLLLSVLQNVFNLLGLSSYFQMVVTGVIVVVALILNHVLERRSAH